MIADNNRLSTIPPTDLIDLTLLKPELKPRGIGNYNKEGKIIECWLAEIEGIFS